MTSVAFWMLVGLGVTTSYQLPCTSRSLQAMVRSSTVSFAGRAAVRLAADGEEESNDDLSLTFGDMDKLRARIAKIQENGGALATPSQKYFDAAMSKPPQQLMQDFFQKRPPQVVQSMQEAVVSLLGALPPLEFDSQLTTTGDKLAALMLQLQMTGYMLRNAEYVMTLRKLLQLKTRSAAEYRTAFERIDLDRSGFIEVGEIESLLKEVYPEEVPPFEVTTFMKLFDADGDGKISLDEFLDALGAVNADAPSVGLLPLLEGDLDTKAPKPEVSGTVKVQLDDGGEVEMDANAYMEELQAEAQALRKALAQVEPEKMAKEIAASTSITGYLSSLPEPQLKLLTEGISDDVVTAMRQIVVYILRAPSDDGTLDKDASVTMEQQKLQQLCLYQMMLGYTLREVEATGEADEAVGR